jgi:hypothetical protein
MEPEELEKALSGVRMVGKRCLFSVLVDPNDYVRAVELAQKIERTRTDAMRQIIRAGLSVLEKETTR